VCSLPSSELQLLEAGLLLGWSARSLASRFGTLNRRAVAFHAKNCLSEAGKDEV
jgi:hypothetical protein